MTSLSKFDEVRQQDGFNDDDDEIQKNERVTRYINGYLLETIKNNRACAESFENFFSSEYKCKGNDDHNIPEKNPLNNACFFKKRKIQQEKRTILSSPISRNFNLLHDESCSNFHSNNSDRNDNKNKKRLLEYQRALSEFFYPDINDMRSNNNKDRQSESNSAATAETATTTCAIKRKSLYSICDEYVKNNMKGINYKNREDHRHCCSEIEGIDSDFEIWSTANPSNRFQRNINFYNGGGDIDDDDVVLPAGDDTTDEDDELLKHHYRNVKANQYAQDNECVDLQCNFISDITFQEMENDLMDPSSSILRTRDVFSNFKNERISSGVKMCIAFDDEIGAECINKVGSCSKQYCWKHYRKFMQIRKRKKKERTNALLSSVTCMSGQNQQQITTHGDKQSTIVTQKKIN